MKYLFWNTMNNNLQNNKSVLIEIINYYSCDFIALAEYNENISELVSDINKLGKKKYYIFDYIGYTNQDRIKIITTYKQENVNLYYDEGYYKILYMDHDILRKQLVAVVHLPSKSNDASGAKEVAMRLKQQIEHYEELINTTNTIILGDFNMNPYEEWMVASYGLHAISSKNDVLSKDERKIYHKNCKMFYNPMWSFMGEYSKTHGSYYYRSGSFCYFWNTFDQVIIRPNLISYLKEAEIEILTSINGINLCKDNGRPNSDKYSDHLPLIFEI